MLTKFLGAMWAHWATMGYIDGLEQERRNSIANALELRLFCTNPFISGFADDSPHVRLK